MTFVLKTSAFPEGGSIPKQYTCDGSDRSPSLQWMGVPQQTKSLALITDDPDAPVGTWTHWMLWNIPVHSPELKEGIPKLGDLPGGARQGRNDFKRVGYGGPCPPPGNPHRYFFRLYALDAPLELKAGASREELEAAMQGHVLSHAEIMGLYGR